jgi:predicted Zn-dependent peptidase
MEYIKKEMGAYNLHLIKTKDFKTNRISISFKEPIVKENITKIKVLENILLLSNKTYQDSRDVAIKQEDLYDTIIDMFNNRVGNYNNLIVYMKALNDKYSEKGNFNKALDFLQDIIFNPDIENNKFKKDKFIIARDKVKAEILNAKEDSAFYAYYRAMEAFDKNSDIAYNSLGYVDDLDSIDEANLYKYYLELIKSSLIDIFVVGDIDSDEITNYFRNNFKIRTFKKQRLDYNLATFKPRHLKLIAKETSNYKQSRLIAICPLPKLSSYEAKYVSYVYNFILGGSSQSHLFLDVREKHSLCYGIGSSYDILDNTLVIHAGIDKDNFKETCNLIEQNIKNLRLGKFNLDEIKSGIEDFNTILDSILDSQGAIIENYFKIALNIGDDIETSRESISKVSKNDIIKLAKKIKIDTIYLLEGDKNGRN